RSESEHEEGRDSWPGSAQRKQGAGQVQGHQDQPEIAPGEGKGQQKEEDQRITGEQTLARGALSSCSVGNRHRHVEAPHSLSCRFIRPCPRRPGRGRLLGSRRPAIARRALAGSPFRIAGSRTGSWRCSIRARAKPCGVATGPTTSPSFAAAKEGSEAAGKCSRLGASLPFRLPSTRANDRRPLRGPAFSSRVGVSRPLPQFLFGPRMIRNYCPLNLAALVKQVVGASPKRIESRWDY